MYFKLLKLANVLIKIFFNINYIGKSNIPLDENFIVCANHKSVLDPIIVALIFKKQIHFMGKSELFEDHGKLFSKLLYSLGAFPVNRDKVSIKSLKCAVKLLDNGEIVGIFPQGRCVRGDDFAFEAKKGVAFIAKKADVPILPISIYSKGSIRPFKKITVRIGKLIKQDELALCENKSNKIEIFVSVIENEIKSLLEEYH